MVAVVAPQPGRIRDMIEADLPEVLQVEQRAYSWPWTYGIFRDCLRAGYPGWVCVCSGHIVGFVLVAAAAGEGHILNLCVSPDRRREGVGRALIDRVIQEAPAHEVQELFLEVRPSNKAAQALYRSVGFEQVGRRRGYYPAAGGREDALVLARLIEEDGRGA
ncbi:[SSU ribosomal protein S18P]-alanine acetyltransferase [Alkalispirillum mobile]|uniref:[Ribosomal protein bS18]-alanine N-acetyltransferase n=1 Tax=Alkalispirillum mobile TaxID=85925 RepID=A0A498C681_9GAMM|nr:ribosomal protein S18-alanine N-acetyltransferase [Alkalispirillum mobile]RLK51202.1 [SSU ribosomal protein S18P]-alanine acetyltransferase [Alkalispirillum mobile]